MKFMFRFFWQQAWKDGWDVGQHYERERIAALLRGKTCPDANCGHTACVVYFNASRIAQGIAV